MSILVRNISFSYLAGIPVLENVSFEVHPGECLLLVGPNGVGKSTLLKLLNGLLKPTSGEILVHGKNTTTTSTAGLAESIMATFQNPSDQIFASSVEKEIRFAPANLNRPNAEALAQETLDMFELTSKAERHPYDLMPAERKLLSIASAVASDSPLLAFDEPTAGLSQLERKVTSNVFRHLMKKGCSLIVATHDLDFFSNVMTRVVVLTDGHAIVDTPRAEFLNNIQSSSKWDALIPLAWRVKRMLEEKSAGS